MVATFIFTNALRKKLLYLEEAPEQESGGRSFRLKLNTA